jgi:hypothetical protein
VTLIDRYPPDDPAWSRLMAAVDSARDGITTAGPRGTVLWAGIGRGDSNAARVQIITPGACDRHRSHRDPGCPTCITRVGGRQMVVTGGPPC